MNGCDILRKQKHISIKKKTLEHAQYKQRGDVPPVSDI